MPTAVEKQLAEAIDTENYGDLVMRIDLGKLGVTDTFQIRYWTVMLDALRGVEVRRASGNHLLLKFSKGHCESVTISNVKDRLLTLMGAEVPSPATTFPAH